MQKEKKGKREGDGEVREGEGKEGEREMEGNIRGERKIWR